MMAGHRLSRHGEARAQQRGYRHRDVGLIIEYGTPTHEGYILRRKDVNEVEREIKRLLDRLHHLAGSAAFIGDDTIRTVFRPRKAQRQRMLRGVA